MTARQEGDKAGKVSQNHIMKGIVSHVRDFGFYIRKTGGHCRVLLKIVTCEDLCFQVITMEGVFFRVGKEIERTKLEENKIVFGCS